jgi:uncharacterized protein YukE
MRIKTIVRMIILVIVCYIAYYYYQNKLSILCIACEEPGLFMKCLPNTGKGTPTCSAYYKVSQEMEDIQNQISSINNSFNGIGADFLNAYKKITDALDILNGAFDDIGKLNIPVIGSITIPSIPAINIDLDFGSIPSLDIDIGLTLNTRLVNPLNNSLTSLEKLISDIISGINLSAINNAFNSAKNDLQTALNSINSVIDNINAKALSVLKLDNIPRISVTLPTLNINTTIPTITIPRLTTIDLKVNINIANLIRSALNATIINLGTLIVNGINNNLVPSLNSAFVVIQTAFNATIREINSGIQSAINSIKNGILTTITLLQNQLATINIFGQITNKIIKLITKVEMINPLSYLSSAILPTITFILPNIRIPDILVIFSFFVTMPCWLLILVLLNIVVDIIPDIDIPIFFWQNNNSINISSDDGGGSDD